jgi:hypothetical protein
MKAKGLDDYFKVIPNVYVFYWVNQSRTKRKSKVGEAAWLRYSDSGKTVYVGNEFERGESIKARDLTIIDTKEKFVILCKQFN